MIFFEVRINGLVFFFFIGERFVIMDNISSLSGVIFKLEYVDVLEIFFRVVRRYEFNDEGKLFEVF